MLRDWLKAHHVTQVMMEATGVYWKPVWHVLEDDFVLLLVNARHVKQVLGRKTDVAEAKRLWRLAEAGLLRSSFVPPRPIRELRQLTRYRKAQIAERQREANRLHRPRPRPPRPPQPRTPPSASSPSSSASDTPSPSRPPTPRRANRGFPPRGRW